VRLLIRDEFGKEETVDFSILFNRTLLNPGVSEWSLAGGTTTDTSAGEPDYQDGAPVIAGSIRTGISETLTGGLSVQTTTDAALAGVSSLSQTALGLIGLDATGSVEEDRDRVGWSLQSELNVDRAMLWEGAGSVQLGAEYRSKGYKSSLDDFATIAANLRLHGSFSQPLPKGFSVALSGYYSTYPSTSDEEYGTSVSLTRVVSDELTIGVSGTYESDRQAFPDASEFGGLSVLARLNYRPSAESVLSVQYDRNTGSTTGSLGSSFEDGPKRVNVGLDLQHLPRTESGFTERVLGADMHMSDSRYEVNASHTRHIQGLGSELFYNRTALNVGTGIAFADGQVGVGRPIRNAFAIVDAHQSLTDSAIRVSPFQDSYRGKIDGFGPAVVSEISAYTTTNLPYEIDDAPPGYDFGSGSFALVAPYKAGYHLTVGSDFAVTAMGILKNSVGEPILLKAGTVFSPAHPEKKILIFTNGAGRFAAQGLKAGAWTIEMNDDDQTTYDVMVPEEATGFFNLGEIMPKGKDSQ
jgi:outer membrane usher protein